MTRLQKHLASAGVASRRASERIIAAGRVTVNGETVTDPARDVTDSDAVAVDGRTLDRPAEPVVHVLHKPRGVVSTASDPQGRPTVVDLVRGGGGRRLYPVGRLDADSTGIILLTDDGPLAHRLTHPSFEVPKTYLASLAGAPISDASIRRLRDGVRLEDGPTAPARVRRVGSRQRNEIELTIHEGRNRQVRRMCEAVGHRVLALRRTAFGPLELGDLATGAVRPLTDREQAALRALTRGGAGA